MTAHRSECGGLVLILKHAFDSSEVNLALEVFLREAVDCLGDDLISVIIYGSLVFDDLAPGMATSTSWRS